MPSSKLESLDSNYECLLTFQWAHAGAPRSFSKRSVLWAPTLVGVRACSLSLCPAVLPGNPHNSSWLTALTFQEKVGIMEVDSERMRMRLMPSPVQCLDAIKVRVVSGDARDGDPRSTPKKISPPLDPVDCTLCTSKNVVRLVGKHVLRRNSYRS